MTEQANTTRSFPDPDTVYIVSGLPRSGTSLMMQMLERAGIEPLTDGIRTADTDNPRGYYELEQVKKIGDDTSWIADARGRAVKLISQLLMELPEAGPYRVVFMRRDLDEILASQEKMLKRRGEDQETDRDPIEMKEIFASHLEEAEAWMRQRDDVSVLFVSYNRLLAEPENHARRLARFLCPEADPEGQDIADLADAALQAVDESLYRNRKS